MLREEVEVCSYCMGENILQWDVEKDGYKAKCQHCGEEMMLCDACFYSDDNENHYCDWCEEDGCWRSRVHANDLEKAKELIVKYSEREFNNSFVDFSDLKNVGVAYTTLTDYEIPIQVSVDLINMKLKTWVGDGCLDEREPDRVEDITMDDLECLDFDDLISGWQTYIEDNIEKYIE